jgi:molybdate transport system permease protein
VNRLYLFFMFPLLLLLLAIGGVIFALLYQLSPAEFLTAFSSEETLFALKLSLIASIAAIGIAIVIGVPSGYTLARISFRGKFILDTILDIPLVMPPLVAGVGLLFLFGHTLLGGMLDFLDIQILFTPLGAALAQAFVATPIVTRTSKAAFLSVNQRYEWVAQTMGMKPVQIFFRVTLSLAKRGILAGLILGWARAMGEFGATLMVAGATRRLTETLPISVYLNISSGELGIAISCAFLLLITGFILLLILRLLEREGQNIPMEK